MATDPRKLRPSELCRLLNSTPLGEVINERQLHRHRTRAGMRIGDARHVDLLRYVAWLVEVRHAPKSEPEGDPYERLKERARARNVALAIAGRDIGDLPAVVSPERKMRAASDFRFFCESYFPLTFHLPWSPDHLKVIEKIEQAVLRGGLFAMAMPRGSGKTTICECACIWAVLNGHRDFVCLIGSDEGHSMDMLDSIKMELDGNDLLLEDFPEVVYPIQALDGIANRCNGQLYKGERTHIGWTAREIVLPTMPGSAASGAIIKVAGITGRIRGMKYKRADGHTVRPALVVIDDPQTDESARSLSQCATREGILAGAILGLAGPGKKISGIMPCTVIRPGDMADNILSRDKHPEWNGERTKMVYAFPSDEKKWQRYGELRAESLSNLDLDGKPRLVRGVAGSGKTVVLSNWLAKTAKRMLREADARIWAVYANRSLHKLLRESIEAAWKGADNEVEFPWQSVSLLHVKDVLAGLLPSVSLSMDTFEFEYDRAAEEFLNRQDEATILPRCQALFIDEAQDMGPNTLRLLLSLVEQSNQDDPNSRSAHIFFDNAQNIYGRKTPKWSDFGLDMRGRSTIMRESFRSTQPITEFAVNLLHRLSPASDLHDHKELIALGLLERTQRGGEEWLRVSFNQVQGPKPFFQRFNSREDEMAALGKHIAQLISKEGVPASEICLIYNGKSVVRHLESYLAPKLADIGVELSVQTNRPFERHPNTLLVTTSHSYKGYDAEVVLIPCADQYTTQDGQILSANLYVAMTRARSVLGIYSLNNSDAAARKLNDALDRCIAAQSTLRVIDCDDDQENLAQREPLR